MAVKLSELTEARKIIEKLAIRLAEHDYRIEGQTEVRLEACLLAQKLYSAENYLLRLSDLIIQLQNKQAAQSPTYRNKRRQQ